MSEIEKIKRYIERTRINVQSPDRYGMKLDELRALAEIGNLFSVAMLAFEFGQAKGYRAAKATVK